MSHFDNLHDADRGFNSFNGDDISTKVIGLEQEGIQMLSQITSRLYQEVESFAASGDEKELNDSPFKDKILLNQENGQALSHPNQKFLNPLMRSISHSETSLLFFLMPAELAGQLSVQVAEYAKQRSCMSLVMLFTTETDEKLAAEAMQEGVLHCRGTFHGIIPFSIADIPQNIRKLNNHLGFTLSNLMHQSIKNILKVVCTEGVINVDLEDILDVTAYPNNLLNVFSTATKGKERANEALLNCASYFNQLPSSLHTLEYMILYLTVSDLDHFDMEELDVLTDGFRECTGKDTNVIFGVSTDGNFESDELEVTVFLSRSTEPKIIEEKIIKTPIEGLKIDRLGSDLLSYDRRQFSSQEEVYEDILDKVKKFLNDQ
ncbi:FtsZ/tubulin family protein [Sediminitomix flava]|uniref:Uncharacterized protein n=1 Tax=Sediminitomix flava TaxID=379075 RepID=A0A315ZB39_SEDFL|nr:hypothetical protein [Sediminitomix flava]PWJ42761.1 hypothetical protein BC781_102306 [Sediminitomix flava]